MSETTKVRVGQALAIFALCCCCFTAGMIYGAIDTMATCFKAVDEALAKAGR